MLAPTRSACRFHELFTEDEDGLPRTWAPKVSIPGITRQARQAAAQSLALLTIKRLGLNEVGFPLAAPLSPGAGPAALPWLPIDPRPSTLLLLQSCTRADLAGPVSVSMQPGRTHDGRGHTQAAEAKVEAAVRGFTSEMSRAHSMMRPRSRSVSRAASLTLPAEDEPSASSADDDMASMENWPGIPQGQVQPCSRSAHHCCLSQQASQGHVLAVPGAGLCQR